MTGRRAGLYLYDTVFVFEIVLNVVVAVFLIVFGFHHLGPLRTLFRLCDVHTAGVNVK